MKNKGQCSCSVIGDACSKSADDGWLFFTESASTFDHIAVRVYLLCAQETGTELFEFCSHALMALEVLIHPRALSLIDSTSDTNLIGAKLSIPGSMYSGDQKGNDFNSGGALGKGNDDPESDDDDLYNTWLGNVGVVDIADTLTENNATIVAPFAYTDPSDFKTK
ncbi:hypothetical protein POM88_012841 [Heracleum sosnowskyi]|uniref:Uncharacterized protein n=1 Tax=Heracleum sosnowskyi TaxID=360622 RepID=A0AAD8IXG9_9APIA|nr:hypothetical protein POM88_012841 [Heracleum sosnowskyi]